MRVCVLSSILLVLASGVGATRVKSCDDDLVLSRACAIAQADPDAAMKSDSCQETEVLVLEAGSGCFVCVNPQSCIVAYDEGPQGKEIQAEGYEEDLPGGETPAETEGYEQDPKYADDPQDAEAQAKDYGEDALGEEPQLEEETPEDAEVEMLNAPAREPSDPEIQPVRNEHARERGIQIHAHQAAVEAAVVAPSKPQAAMQEVSNWYFMIPALLALVSVGIAVRGRMERRPKVHFEHVETEDAEEINPFCADPECNPQQDDQDLEYGTHPGDSDDSDGENYHTH